MNTPEEIRKREQVKKRRQRMRFKQLAGGGGGVHPFSFQSETETLIANSNFGAAPSANRKRTIDRAIKRLKQAGLWDKCRFINPVGANTDASLTNWKNPAEKASIVGSPTFTANVGWVGVSTTGYVNTGIVANTLSQNDLSVYVWSQSTTTSSNNDCGATNASSEGITLAVRRATDNNLGVRLAGAFDQVSPSGDSDGFGLSGASRSSSVAVVGQRNGVEKTTVARASAALPALPIFFCTNNGNGSPSTTSGRQLAFLWLGTALTIDEQKKLTAIMGEYLHTVFHGDYYIEDLATGTRDIVVNCVAYGFTVASIMFALQAARQGKTVAICGGWRDRYNLGGTVSGGLGFTDFDNLASLGGLSRYFITRANALQGVADTSFKMRPRIVLGVCKELLDSTKNGGFSIPLYISNGVQSVTKSGAAITSFKTTDGRSFTASQFFDGSYEGDILQRAGVGYTIGREAAGSGTEANNGVKLSTTNLLFQPWNTTNTPASGLIPNVHGVRSTFSPLLDTVGADGTADSHVQAYNFRLTLTNLAPRRVPLPTTPPSNYDVANYEFLLRFLAANATVDTFEELFKEDVLYNDTYDVNNENFISSDFVTHATDSYPTASYSGRETHWKNTWNYILGFLYTCQYGTDGRIPAALKTSMAAWGFCQDHYYAPHERDEIFHNPQLYVRESIRMVSDAVLNGNDLTAVDATAIRISDHTISTISYQTDSHAVQRVAHETSAGSWTTKNEGGLGVATGGVDLTTPVPFEIAVPKASECTNLSVGFCISCTHVGFGAYRMEPTMWQVGQSMGLAAALAIDGDNVIQNVNYATLRTALLASNVLGGELDPVLPQVN